MTKRVPQEEPLGPQSDWVELRRVDRSSADGEQLFRALLDNTSDATVTFDDSLVIIDANPAALELLQASRSVVIDRPLDNFLTPSASSDLSNAQWLTSEKAKQQGEARIRRTGGSVIDIYCSIVREAAPGFHLAILRVKPSHSHAEELLEFLARASSVLADNLDFNVSISRLSRLAVPTIADWVAVDVLEGDNIRRVAISHIDPIRVELAHELWRRWPSTLQDPSGIGAVIRTGRLVLCNEISDAILAETLHDPELIEIIRRLGPTCALCVPISVHGRNMGAITLASAESGRRFGPADQAVAQDLAHRIAITIENAQFYASEQLARQLAELANKAKDDFIATLSHELRTPLNSIMGWASLLQAGDVSTRQRERAIEVIKRNAVSQASLIEDLLDVSRIASGKMRLTLHSVNMAQLVELVRDTLKPASDAKRIHIETHVDSRAGEIIGDQVRLQQLISNLLNNAIKFTPEGGSVVLALEQSDHELTLRVADNGRGIKPEFISTIFERFRQGDAGNKAGDRGLGLGLAISKHIVQLHGGRITVESEGPDLGTTFTVTLPRLVAKGPLANDEPPSDRGWRFIGQRELHGVRILVIDDEQDARDMAAAVLAGRGAVVDTSATVEGALQRFHQVKPDVIVSDIGLPETDGYEFIRSIRALSPEEGGQTPAVALTAHARAEDRQEALGAGYTKHLPKPIEPAELVSAVTDLLLSRASR